MKFSARLLKKAGGYGGNGGGFFSNSPIQRGKPAQQDNQSIDKYLLELQATPETAGVTLTPAGEQGTQGHQAPWQVYHDYPLSRKKWKVYDPAQDPSLMNNPKRRHVGLPLPSEKMNMVGKKAGKTPADKPEYQQAARELLSMFRGNEPEDWQSPTQDFAAASGLEADWLFEALTREMQKRGLGSRIAAIFTKRKTALTGLWNDIMHPEAEPQQTRRQAPAAGSCPKCGGGLTRRGIPGGDSEMICTKCEYAPRSTPVMKGSAAVGEALPITEHEIPDDPRPGGTGDYDFYKADSSSPAGEEEWIAMKQMGIRGGLTASFLRNGARYTSGNPDYGLRWQEFDKNDRITTKEKWFTSSELREGFANKIEAKDNFKEFVAWSDPKEREEAPNVEALARQHQQHDSMCDLGNPVCKAYTDMRIADPGWWPGRNASKLAWQAPPPPPQPLAHVQKAPHIKRPAPPKGTPDMYIPANPAEMKKRKEQEKKMHDEYLRRNIEMTNIAHQKSGRFLTIAEAKAAFWNAVKDGKYSVTGSGDIIETATGRNLGKVGEKKPDYPRMECCGSITEHHKPNCPKQDKVFNDTLGRLYPKKAGHPLRFTVPTVDAGAVAAMLHEKGLSNFMMEQADPSDMTYVEFKSPEERTAAAELVKDAFRQQINSGKGFWQLWALPDMSGEPQKPTVYSSLQGEHRSLALRRTGFLRTGKTVDDATLLQAAGAFLQFLKNTPEGRRADTQGPEMELPNPNWGPREPQAYAGIRDWGVWEIPRDAEGDTEDYDWKELSEASGKKLDQYQKVFKTEAKTKFPGLKFDLSGSEKNWLSITVTQEKKVGPKAPVS